MKNEIMQFVTKFIMKSGYDISKEDRIEHCAVFGTNRVFVIFHPAFMATGDVKQFGKEIVKMSHNLELEIEKALLKEFKMKCAVVQVSDTEVQDTPIENEMRNVIRIDWL